MEQIEIILRTTDPTGKVTEQLLAKFDTEKPATESDEVLEYSGLCIDSLRHQASYQGQEISLTENYEFHTLAYLASVLYHQEYPPEAAEGYKERIYPDCVGSRIQICGCPRGVSPWDVSFW